jgi:hypothetical protein
MNALLSSLRSYVRYDERKLPNLSVKEDLPDTMRVREARPRYPQGARLTEQCHTGFS